MKYSAEDVNTENSEENTTRKKAVYI